MLVWIYGGGFAVGYTSDPMYNGENLAKKGVILVSIAYRVGQPGFLAHPELSKESPNHVNGVKTIDIIHDAGFLEGSVGFQLCHYHSLTAVDVKSLYIREL